MKTLLFLSWRDIKHPKRGGAEVFTHEMLKRLNQEDYRVTHISPATKGNLKEECIDGINYKRRGNWITVILYAMSYYFYHRKEIDLVVDQCNSHRFFTPFWVKKEKRLLFIHQMTREIWEMKLKKPFGSIGRRLEDYMTRIYRHNHCITVSKSTKSDLMDLGFRDEWVHILPEGINFKPWKKEAFEVKNHRMFSYVGRFSEYKGIDDAMKAFCMMSKERPDLIFNIIGKKNEAYINEKLLPILKQYGVSEEHVIFHGFVSEEKKLELMSQSYCLLFPSKREGWGLTVTESAAVGTPSIVYKSPGLVDAVEGGKSGYLCEENTSEAIVACMRKAFDDSKLYDEITGNAYDLATRLNWGNTAIAFDMTMKKVLI